MPVHSHRFGVTTIALAAVFLALPSGTSRAQSSPTGNATDQEKHLCTVSGIVLAAVTNEPLKKARVAVEKEGDNPSAPYVAITGADGRFSISGIPAGRYDMYVERQGYVRKSYGEDEHGNSSTILSLSPAQQVSDLKFHLHHYAAISGRIVDEDGDPAEHLTVNVLKRRIVRGKAVLTNAGQADTNDLGEYRVFDLRPGRYLVRASLGLQTERMASGFAPTYYPNTTDVAQASVIELKPGDETSGVDLMLIHERLYKISGHVLNTVSNHAFGMTVVQLVREDAGSYDIRTDHRGSAADKSGSFEINDVTPGTYTVFSIWFDVDRRLYGSAQVEVTDADVNSVQIEINRGTDVRGRIIADGNGTSAADVRVFMVEKNPMQFGLQSATTKADGTFLVTSVPDGRYEIDLRSGCEKCYVKAATVGGQDIIENGLQIGSGAAPGSIEVVYSSRTGTVDGTVVKDDGTPAAGATVVLVPDPPRRERWILYSNASTDQYGHFIANNVTPGNYHAFAWQDLDDGSYMDPEFLQPFENAAQGFSLADNQKLTLQLTLLPKHNDSE